MRKEIIVVDGFYNDPEEIRKQALDMDYSIRGNYPGTRTGSLPNGDVRSFLESLLAVSYTHLTLPTTPYV